MADSPNPSFPVLFLTLFEVHTDCEAHGPLCSDPEQIQQAFILPVVVFLPDDWMSVRIPCPVYSPGVLALGRLNTMATSVRWLFGWESEFALLYPCCRVVQCRFN